MEKYLTGNEVIEKHPIQPFQLLELVRLGLMPREPKDKLAVLTITEEQYEYLLEKGEVPAVERSLTSIIKATHEALFKGKRKPGEVISPPDFTEHPCLVLDEGLDVSHRLLEFVYAERQLISILREHGIITNGVIAKSTSKTKRRPHGKIYQEAAAKLCGVGLRTIQRWDAGGKNTPPDYPGRADAVVFRMFANQYNQQKRIEAAAKAASNAAPTDPSDIDRARHKNAFKED